MPTLAVVCCYLDVPFVFSGLETLPLKESDRIAALVSELGKCGYMLYYDDVAQLTWSGERKTVQNPLRIHTYNDHRMAMAFAPIAAVQDIIIEDIEVVSKSYPGYWENMHRFCTITEEK